MSKHNLVMQTNVILSILSSSRVEWKLCRIALDVHHNSCHLSPKDVLCDRLLIFSGVVMPVDQMVRDEKNNNVAVTLFETYLSKFMLEHPEFYQQIYFKLFDSIDHFVSNNPEKNETIKAFMQVAPPGFSLPRYMYSVFSRVELSYSGYSSFEQLKVNFNLQPADYFIKIIADELLKTRTKQITLNSSNCSAFFVPSYSGTRSPFNNQRCPELFDDANRGVSPALSTDGAEDEEDLDNRDIGIVSTRYTPFELQNYFKQSTNGARFNYQPKEDSYVAQWLRARNLPVISGSSGSTEMLFTRILPLVSLTYEETRILIFTQACSMLANGHHSLFEAMLVAQHFCHKLDDKETLLEFYLQCIPESILASPQFVEFLDSELVKPLLLDMPLFQNRETMSARASVVPAGAGMT